MSIFTTMITYGAAVWAHKVIQTKVRASVLKSQRKALLRLTGAANTTSTMALLIATGIEPIDLTIRLRGATYWLKSNNISKVKAIIGKACKKERRLNESYMINGKQPGIEI